MDCLPNYSIIHFVINTYSNNISIKNIERLGRGLGNTVFMKGPPTKIPRKWKSFPGKVKNKNQLNNLLLTEGTERNKPYIFTEQSINKAWKRVYPVYFRWWHESLPHLANSIKIKPKRSGHSNNFAFF